MWCCDSLISSCLWMRSLQRSRYLDCVVLYSVITSTNLRDSVEYCEGTKRERERQKQRDRERQEAADGESQRRKQRDRDRKRQNERERDRKRDRDRETRYRYRSKPTIDLIM